MNRTALVTGASTGIGYAISEVLAKDNYNVIINYINYENKALELKEKIIQDGGNAIVVKADISKRKEVDNMFEVARNYFGQIDVLVNNAGISKQNLFTDIKDSEWNNMIDTNINGIFYCTQNAIKDMISRKQGSIINISSIWGITGASCEVHYSTTKSAIIGFTKALAKELGPSNIRVNCIAPGLIDTEMNSNISNEDKENIVKETPLMRIGTVKDIALAAEFFASDSSKFITGHVLNVSGGLVI
ncbi:elongation factor P 5-aminopentanone reductase [Miniphocaeibacter massiliensis]|uniref:elongation factor P 5-aminopentanone reductase n=1 Tax=Miniphocaeibacter massiliensis TaxID=2041841 RepID=UPI000C0817AA|nr:3-oxoacyl-ACP reductase FabG [Miniphocaeibacter massiliensis]